MDRKIKVQKLSFQKGQQYKVNFKEPLLYVFNNILYHKGKYLKKMALLFNEEELKIGTLEESIRDSLRRLLFTKIGEIPGLPDIGSRLYLYFDEPADEVSANDILNEVQFLIENYEPRITTTALLVDYDGNGVIVEIKYIINSDPTQTERFAEFYETKSLTI